MSDRMLKDAENKIKLKIVIILQIWTLNLNNFKENAIKGAINIYDSMLQGPQHEMKGKFSDSPHLDTELK